MLTARRLKPYFLGFSILVRTNLTIKEVLRKVDHSGQLSKWCVELTEYEITYEPRKAIKVQAIADFIAELPLTDEEANRLPEPVWTLHVDGSSGTKKQGVGLIL